jgi:hypothetical protein
MGVFVNQGEAMKRICILLLTVSAILVITPFAATVNGQTTVGAEIHAEHNLHLNDQGRGKNFHEFMINRGWLWVDHSFSERYEAHLTIESDEPFIGESNNTGWTMRLRHAYLQVNDLISNVDAQVGMIDNYYIARVEEVWGLRFVDRVSLHKLGYLPEADLGGSLVAGLPGDWAVLVLQILNGASYTARDMNKYKDFALLAELRPFAKNPDFSETAVIGQYYMGYPNMTDGSGGASFSENTKKDRLSGAAIFQYRNWFRGFVEVFVTQDDNDWTNDTSDEFVNEAQGFSVFGRSNIATSDTWLARVKVFGKYERVDRNRNAENTLIADDSDSRHLIAGASYEPVDGYEIAFSVRRDTENVIVDNSFINEEESNSFMVSLRALLQ